jgi:hypothetical protein
MSESAFVSPEFCFLFSDVISPEGYVVEWSALPKDLRTYLFSFLCVKRDFLALRHSCRSFKAASDKLPRLAQMKSYSERVERDWREAVAEKQRKEQPILKLFGKISKK